MDDSKGPQLDGEDSTLVPESSSVPIVRTANALKTPPPASDAATSIEAPPVLESPADAVTAADVTGSRYTPASPAGGAWDASQLQPGTVLGNRYQILQLLGEGGMGSVYKARDREVARTVALKVIRPDLAAKAAIIERFKQELVLSHQVTHKNVVRIYDLGEAGGVKFMTMEYIEGEDLRKLIQEKTKFPPEEAVEIMRQVCRALEAAHAVGVIHRDLKPQNVMRDHQGRVVVMDFGLARSLESDGMTQTGAIIGTMEYMSPEQGLGKHLDERSDLFTVGLIFYELLTGKMPYKADSALASLLKRTQERAAPVSEHDASIPRPLSDIVAKCLEPNIRNRYRSVAEILTDLEAWEGKGAAASLRFSGVKPWGQTLPWPLFGGILAVLVLAVVAFLFRGKLFGPSSKQAVSGPVVSVAILPFRNASGNASFNWLGPTLAEMLRTDMGQSASLRTVPSDRVNQILHDLRVELDANLDPDTLRRVAEFTSADRLLWGQYIKLGDQIRIDATLQDLKRQRNFVLKAEASNEKDLPRAIEQLARSVQEDLALSPDTIKELLAKTLKPSTQSVQALAYYTEGLQLARQGKNLEALKKLEASTKEDPEFALGYSNLARAYAALGYDNEAEKFSRKAVDLSDKVSPQEKYLILANRAQVLKDYSKAIEFYENLGKILPNDPDVQIALAHLYEDARSADKALQQYRELLARDSKNMDALVGIGRVELGLFGNPQGSLDYLNQALALSVQLENEDVKATTLYTIGAAYSAMNKPNEAIRNYKESLEIRRRLNDKGGVAQILNLMAEDQQFLGKVDEALKNYQEALRIRREIGDRRGIGGTLLDLGNLYESRGQYDQALSVTKESLQIERELGDAKTEATCLNNIGWTYLDKADYDNAMTYSQQALQLREKLQDPSAIAETLHVLGEISSRVGRYDQGINYYLKALELWRKTGDKRSVAIVSHSLGTLFQYQGRYGAALKSEEDALKGFRELNERGAWMAQIQSAYGNALTLIGKGDDAQKNLDEAMGLARELKNDALIAQILNFQGDRLFYRGDFKSAGTLFEQAGKVAARTTDRQQILVSRFNLAKFAIEEGHSSEPVAALKTLAAEADRLGLEHLSVECSTYLAEALINSKDYSRAQHELDHTLANSEKLGLGMLLAKNHYLLATVLRLTRNDAEASRHYGEAHRILDETRKEAGSDNILKRSDVALIYSESARWSPAPHS